MPDHPKIDHAKAMTKAERAEADKERLAMLSPAFAQGPAAHDAREARMKELLDKPAGARSAKEEVELEELMAYEISVLAGSAEGAPRGVPQEAPGKRVAALLKRRSDAAAKAATPQNRE